MRKAIESFDNQDLKAAEPTSLEPGPALPAQPLARRWRFLIAAAAVLALSAKIFVSLTTFGTNDVYIWRGFLSYMQTDGPLALYRDVPLFIHPPFIIHMLRLWGWLAAVTFVPFEFWLRLPAILADAGTLWLTLKVLLGQRSVNPAPLLLLALAPASVMISGFHGNTDPVMIFFVVLGTFLVQTRQSPLPALRWA